MIQRSRSVYVHVTRGGSMQMYQLYGRSYHLIKVRLMIGTNATNITVGLARMCGQSVKCGTVRVAAVENEAYGGAGIPRPGGRHARPNPLCAQCQRNGDPPRDPSQLFSCTTRRRMEQYHDLQNVRTL